jgi:uncharacterized protein YkwD
VSIARPLSEEAPPAVARRRSRGTRIAGLCATVAALALVVPTVAAASDCPAADVQPSAATLAAAADTTLCLLNVERADDGLAPLRRNGALDRASTAFSARMVAERFFAHVAPDGVTLAERLQAAGYLAGATDWFVGENIAWGQSQLSTPRSIVDAWMKSTGHRENILNREFTEIGVGIVAGSPIDRSWGATYTTDFGYAARSSTVTTPSVGAAEPAATPVAPPPAAIAAPAPAPAPGALVGSSQPSTSPQATQKPAPKASAAKRRPAGAACAKARRGKVRGRAKSRKKARRCTVRATRKAAAKRAQAARNRR